MKIEWKEGGDLGWHRLFLLNEIKYAVHKTRSFFETDYSCYEIFRFHPSPAIAGVKLFSYHSTKQGKEWEQEAEEKMRTWMKLELLR